MIGFSREGRLVEAGQPTVASEPILGMQGSGGETGFVDLDAAPLLSVVVSDPAATPVQEGLVGAAGWRLAVKRVMDVIGSLVALVLFAPVLVVVAVAIGATSSGPILYRQQRVGRGGKPFTMYKFRSMEDRAHEQRDHHRHMNEATGPVFKIREDPRVTRVGRVIRRMSIDELPQFVNVLLGQMSMVGPRPALPEECAMYTEREMGRLLVKPGITCRWQVSGRSDLDFETWVDLDLEYIRTWSLHQDLVLLLRTVPAVLFGKGAY
ncbi:MAG: sugar transferase [Actinomycetota bacterium]